MMQWLNSLKIHDFASTSRRLQGETKVNTSTASSKIAESLTVEETGTLCNDPSEVKLSNSGLDIGGMSTIQEGNNDDSSTTEPADSTTVVASSDKSGGDAVGSTEHEQLGDIGQVSSSNVSSTA